MGFLASNHHVSGIGLREMVAKERNLYDVGGHFLMLGSMPWKKGKMNMKFINMWLMVP